MLPKMRLLSFPSAAKSSRGASIGAKASSLGYEEEIVATACSGEHMMEQQLIRREGGQRRFNMTLKNLRSWEELAVDFPR